MTASRRSVLAMGAGGLLAVVPSALRAAVRVLPDRPCHLTRRLDRVLLDGAVIQVERKWRIMFTEQLNGCVVQGTQVSVAVDAPPSLKALADIELNRNETALFPLTLDRDGLLPVEGTASAADDMKEALDAAETFIAAAPADPDRKAQARAFASSLDRQASRMLSRLPRDLFFPRSLEWSEDRDLALASGSIGRVSIRFQAQTTPETGLLQSAERAIVTTIEDASRTSREVWELTS